MQSIYILLRKAVGGAVRKLWTKTAATAQAAQPSNALLPSRHTWVDLQDRHTRSPDQELSKPWPHFKHFRTFFSYSRSEVGREYFLLSSIAFNVARKQTPNYTNSRPNPICRFGWSAMQVCAVHTKDAWYPSHRPSACRTATQPSWAAIASTMKRFKQYYSLIKG